MQDIISSCAEVERPRVSTRSASNNLRVALEAAEAGIPVFPCRESGPGLKRPYTANGFHDATTDPDRIVRMWAEHPFALAGAPTGPQSGFWVLDIDKDGLASLPDLLQVCGLEDIADLSSVWAKTPSGGLHFYFAITADTAPRTRSSDIAQGIDTRGLGGYVVVLGNVLPDGRSYRIGGGMIPDAPQAPRPLPFLATFNRRERELINNTSALRQSISEASPSDWLKILQTWRNEEAAKIAANCNADGDEEGMRRQALHDLRAVAAEFACLTDGRRQKLFSLACKAAKYVARGVLTDIEFRSTLMEAARVNGSLEKHGAVWAVTTIRNAINRASRDPLPPLARAFRSEGSSR